MFIAIDGGGTKTLSVAANAEGKILAVHKGPGTNVADIGLDECRRRLHDQLSALLGDLSAPVDSVYAGIAGTANAINHDGVHRILCELLPNAKIIDNGSDALSPLYGEAEEGIVMIAGTGSSAFAVSKRGIKQVGGWGYLIDDAGSGFAIGKAVLNAAFRDFDGRDRETELTDMVRKKLNKPINEAIPDIYAGGKSFVASFAPLAFKAMRCGDMTAFKITWSAAKDLAKLLKTCLKYVDARPATAVITGGLTEDSIFVNMIANEVGNKILLVKPDVPPVYGALVKAVRNAGLSIGEGFKENFRTSDSVCK